MLRPWVPSPAQQNQDDSNRKHFVFPVLPQCSSLSLQLRNLDPLLLESLNVYLLSLSWLSGPVLAGKGIVMHAQQTQHGSALSSPDDGQNRQVMATSLPVTNAVVEIGQGTGESP